MDFLRYAGWRWCVVMLMLAAVVVLGLYGIFTSDDRAMMSYLALAPFVIGLATIERRHRHARDRTT